MITEQDLREAIAECEGTRNPNANTCIKLAAYYTILDNLKRDSSEPTLEPLRISPSYSYSAGDLLQYSDSEFSQLMQEKGIERIFPLIDELMDALMVVNPRLYDSVIRKMENV